MKQFERIYLYDTTLRDGQQTKGINFNFNEKIQVIKKLDELGIDYIEAGYPGSNPVDDQLFDTDIITKKAKIAAFVMTKKAGVSFHNDHGMQSLLKAKCKTKCIFGKTWDLHVTDALKIQFEENLHIIKDSIDNIKKNGFEVIFDCEHFFDGMKNNPNYALECLEAAQNADWLVLCDTNGGTMPSEIYQFVTKAKQNRPKNNFGIHTHNDTGNAIANTLAAIDAGARHVQGTINGLGERCGNADLISIIPTLKLKNKYAQKFYIDIDEKKLQQIKKLSQWFDEMLNRNSNPAAPYVGEHAFSHKGGIHASAIIRNAKTYEHIEPELVGNKRDIPVSSQAGKSNIISKLKEYDIAYDKNSDFIARFTEIVKQKEAQGFSYDYADASLKLLALRELTKLPQYFQIDSFRVIVEQRYNAVGKLIHISEAVVKLFIEKEKHVAIGEGNGPVHALDQALRKALASYKTINKLKLDDYKVRIIGTSAAALTRVIITTVDKNTHYWTTIGVSTNIVDASLQALTDSLIYGLFVNQKK